MSTSEHIATLSCPESEEVLQGQFTLRVLPAPFGENSIYERSGKDAEYEAFKSHLSALGNHVLSPNSLGRLAFGLVKGRMDTLYSSRSTGLYEAAGYDGDSMVRGITFHDPSTLATRWRERTVGPTLRAAMKNIVKKAANTETS